MPIELVPVNAPLEYEVDTIEHMAATLLELRSAYGYIGSIRLDAEGAVSLSVVDPASPTRAEIALVILGQKLVVDASGVWVGSPQEFDQKYQASGG